MVIHIQVQITGLEEGKVFFSFFLNEKFYLLLAAMCHFEELRTSLLIKIIANSFST